MARTDIASPDGGESSPDGSESSDSLGRRELHKKRTRRDLQQAALELFAEQGFDETTTEEVAAKAGVSPRTFFRYFPTKESVLFAGEYGWLQSLSKHFLAQPASRSDLEALHDTLIANAPRLTDARASFERYERAIASSPILRGRVHDNLQEDITRLSETIAQRRGLATPDEGCQVLAHIVLVLYRRAIRRWTSRSENRSPEQLITEEFNLLVGQVPTTVNLATEAAAG